MKNRTVANFSHFSKDKPKAGVKGYQPEPFFFREQLEGGVRLIAWTPNLHQLHLLFYNVLDTFPEEVEVLLKVEKGSVDSSAGEWERHYGKSPLSKLKGIIKSSEEFVFRDGHSQLSIKQPDAGDYLTVDEHGTLFLYIYSSNLKKMTKLFEVTGFEEGKEKLISDMGHWHVIPKNAEELGRKFIKRLRLRPVKNPSCS